MGSLWMVAASFLFACMGVCVKLGADRFSAGELVFYRGLVAVLLMLPFVGGHRLPLATPVGWDHFWRGLSGFVSLAAYFYAITRIPLATAVTLNYTAPLFLALLVIFWAREAPARGLPLALAAGFVGIVLVLQPTLAREQWMGGLLALGSGMTASLAYWNVRRLGELGEPEWRTVFYFSLFSALGGLPWALAGGSLHAIDPAGGLLLLGVGGFGTAAQLCMTAAYKRGRTLVSASLAYTTVAFSSFFAFLLWDETLPPAAWAGVVLITGSGIAAMALPHAASAGRE
ncbi:MAG: DMT family transporter [Candidatus Nitricoxidivorans perseverans]|uniref:DMT family transporter n=1 Tax=Candidatus Nitricoxidivorans perseverans TaxID=2975601 RepID=A0AA49FKA8_9PROT|nr:MAG: DMT family transporter [Candidatus Nitricoxidivorans perseverans]